MDDNTQVPLYHCKIDVESSSAFRVVTTETVSVPAGHTMVVPAHIPDWKRPLEEMDAFFQPSSRFDETKDASASCILFNLSEEIFPVRMQNSGDETMTLYKHTNLGTSEIIGMPTLNWVAKRTERVGILTRISEGVTPYIITRYMAPPTETDKKCLNLRHWYRMAKVPSFSVHGVVLTLY